MSAPTPSQSAQTETEQLQQHMSVLFEVEKLSTTISKVKSKRIVLDNRRQKNREALRACADMKQSEDIDNDSMYIDMSGTMVKLPLEVAEKFLTDQQREIDSLIILTTKELKQLISDLQLVAPSRGIDPKELEMLLRD
jgi:hypothetical protein